MALVQPLLIQKEQKESVLDKILKGVNLANGIVQTYEGVRTMGDKIDASRLGAQKLQDEKSGIYWAKEIDPTKTKVESTPFEGSTNIKRRLGDTVEDVYVAQRPQELSPKDRAELDMMNRKFGLEQQKFNQEQANPSKNLSAGETEIDKKFAGDLNDWMQTGKPGFEKNMTLLEGAKSKLEQLSKEGKGPGKIMGNLPDFITPEYLIEVRDDVRRAATSSLKAALGASFGEKEGERIMKQSYDERLSPEANIKKIDVTIKELNDIANNKEAASEYFRQNGTLKGFSVKSSGGLNDLISGKKPASQFNTQQEAGIERVMKDNKISRDQAIKALKDAGKL